MDAQRGIRIRAVRSARSWSQQQAAEATGVRREMWAKWEAGAEPGAKALAAMAANGIDVLYILTGQRLTGARRDEGEFMLGDAAERDARGEPPIPGLVETLQGMAVGERRKAERAESMALVNNYLSALDDEEYKSALEMLMRYGRLRVDDRLAVNRMVAGLAADRR